MEGGISMFDVLIESIERNSAMSVDKIRFTTFSRRRMIKICNSIRIDKVVQILCFSSHPNEMNNVRMYIYILKINEFYP